LEAAIHLRDRSMVFRLQERSKDRVLQGQVGNHCRAFVGRRVIYDNDFVGGRRLAQQSFDGARQ
jgi:hypothetical protein